MMKLPASTILRQCHCLNGWGRRGAEQQEWILQVTIPHFFASLLDAIHWPISTRSQRSGEHRWCTKAVSVFQGAEKYTRWPNLYLEDKTKYSILMQNQDNLLSKRNLLPTRRWLRPFVYHSKNCLRRLNQLFVLDTLRDLKDLLFFTIRVLLLFCFVFLKSANLAVFFSLVSLPTKRIIYLNGVRRVWSAFNSKLAGMEMHQPFL